MGEPRLVVVEPEELTETVKQLLSAEKLLFETLTVIDEGEKGFRLVYIFHSLTRGGEVRVETLIPREKPVAPSLSGILPAVHPYELEAHDLFGIHFAGNRGLREGFLKPPEMKGVYPLRKR